MAFLRWCGAALAASFLIGLAGCSGGVSLGGGTAPLTPTGLVATAPDATTVTLSWNGSSRFTGYRIYRNDVEIATTAAANYTDSGLSPVTNYRYFVRGESLSGLSGASNTVSVTTPNMLSLTLARLLDQGGRSHMSVRDVAFNGAGELFIAGGAFSANFPTTAGAHDRTFASGGSSTGSAGASDVFVMKFSRAGQLLWSTLLGGPNYDRAYAIEIAPDGGVVVAGRAGEGFPTTGGTAQPGFAGDSNPSGLYGAQDGFVAKLSADGSTLLWSTYFGDSRSGAIRDIAVDSNGKVYIAGWFFGGLAHITGDAEQGSVNGAHDLVFARLSADGSNVEYATYLGGTEPAGARPGTPSIALSASRNAFLLTTESSSDAPTTPNAYQRSKAGSDDLYVARFDAAGQLVYATYLGGSADEDLETHNIAVDGSGRAAIAAVTSSTNYPTTAFAYQASYGGGSHDGVVSILSPDGSTLVASTFIGGTGREDVQGVAFAPDGLLYLSGGVRSSGLRTTSNAFRANFSGVEDGFLAGFLPDLRGAPYVSYIGGGDEDISRALDIAADGAILIGGHTASFNFPVTGGGSTAPNGPITGWWALHTP
jgi:hypothetical protein